MSFDYDQYDAMGLAALVRAGDVSPAEVLDEALARVEQRNPALNAVVMQAEDVARKMIKDGLPDGPFTGVPFLLKDLGAEAIDFPTNNGSKLFAGNRYSYDSEIYLRLKQAGLVTFGRTTSPECGVGPVTESKVYGGPTRNPWNTNHTSGGSSGGAGAAVAAGILPAAHGSDGGGSVRIPASSCGLVGFKPTRARMADGPVAGEGWAGMAIDGFLTRSLRDTAALFDATMGPDLGAPYYPPPLSGTFSEAIVRPPKRLRIAICDRTLDGNSVHPECQKAVKNTGSLLAGLGHEVEAFDEVIDTSKMMKAWTNIVACGTALTMRGAPNDDDPDADQMEGVTRGALRLADTLSGADYIADVGAIQFFGRRMAQVFLNCDVLVTPTLAAPPMAVGVLKPDNEDFADYRIGPGGVFDYSPFTAIFNASGQPAISLPLHWSADDLPVGVHFAAAFGEDELLMALSGQIEQAQPWAPKQQFLIDRLR